MVNKYVDAVLHYATNDTQRRLRVSDSYTYKTEQFICLVAYANLRNYWLELKKP